YAAAPTAAGSHKVTVVNPTPDGKTSNSPTLTINPAVAVVLTPNNATVRGGTSMTLHATVQNNPDHTLSFSVNGIAGGNATVGTVSTDSTGALFYNVPVVLPGAMVTIAAKSGVDPNATASITVNLQNPAPVITGVTPSTVTIGSTQQLTITGTGLLSSSTV